jgi:exoribonuclease R
MSKAKDSTDNIGHYGLAFEYYSHFTTNRRYPDVMVHRLLQHYSDGGNQLMKKRMKPNVYIIIHNGRFSNQCRA